MYTALVSLAAFCNLVLFLVIRLLNGRISRYADAELGWPSVTLSIVGTLLFLLLISCCYAFIVPVLLIKIGVHELLAAIISLIPVLSLLTGKGRELFVMGLQWLLNSPPVVLLGVWSPWVPLVVAGFWLYWSVQVMIRLSQL